MAVGAKNPSASISALESKLETNPWFPGFAHLAACYLEDGKVQKAIEVSLAGLAKFPQYATGRLVLGKCYEAQGRNIEAMLEYRRALKVVPDNRTVQALLQNVEQREQEAFRVFAEERTRKLKERKDSLTFEKYVAESGSEKESTVDFLLKRLQETKTHPQPAEGRAISAEQQLAPPGANKIVTATLAEIYANQGEYKEAIEAYKKLAERRPKEAERYERRIAQLEDLARLHQAEQKPPGE
jgi:tetratricopeptide (TPR) repeat protein